MNVTIDNAIALLNEALEADPDAISALCNFRLPCNEKLAHHPTVQVGQISEERKIAQGIKYEYEVGILGVLNGIFGFAEDGRGYLCAEIEDDTGRVLKFRRTHGEGS